MFADTDGADRISRKVPADHWLTAATWKPVRSSLAKLDELAPDHRLDTSFSSPTLVYGILLKDGGGA
jgi:hypothetical protein